MHVRLLRASVFERLPARGRERTLQGHHGAPGFLGDAFGKVKRFCKDLGPWKYVVQATSLEIPPKSGLAGVEKLMRLCGRQDMLKEARHTHARRGR